MKTVPNSNRVIRLAADVHREAKIIAASEGLTLAGLVGQALERELARRARRRARADAPAVPLPLNTL